jgi:SpoVK/Ycf46/Vps4 family AAA+-type ATPase
MLMSTTNTVSLSGMEEISMLFNSRRRAILVNTFEEERFLEDLKSLIEVKRYEAYTWSITAGLRDLISGDVAVKNLYDPIRLMNYIAEYDKQAVFVLKDFHDIWTNYQAKRALRDILETKQNVYKPLLLISPYTNIPTELEKLITVVEYELPTREQVIEELEGMEAFLRNKGLPVPEGREREAIIHALVGMTKTEIVNVLKKSVAKNKKIVLEEIVAEKEQVIRKTGLLEYITKLGRMEDVGGMDIFKEWLEDAKYAFDLEARKYKIDPVRGAIAVGVSGTGKSLLAKSLAHLWNLPLLKMNMSDIMDSRVGQSEKNIDRALKLAEAVAPCVLWIDEIEKGLAGVASSDRSDSGTLSRVVQSLLTWLSEKEAPVFVIATANDITKLPPELTRAGRFDEIFFVSLPHQKEREEILRIHLRKRGYEVDSNTYNVHVFSPIQIANLAAEMKGFTGAEIEQVVAEAGRRAYAAFKKGQRDTHYITENDLREQIHKIVPLSRRNPDLIRQLREWAKASAKCASSEEHKFLHGSSEKDDNYEPLSIDFNEDDLILGE